MAYSYEEYLSMGYDSETAKSLSKVNKEASAGAPFRKISMNYSDILQDDGGVKKGNFVAGYKEDKANLIVKETGTDFGNTIEFIIIGNVYQVSHYDINTKSTVFQTPFFFDPYETKQQVDKKSGMSVSEWKAGGRRATFNNILLMLVNEGNEWTPYTHYLHGTNLHQWGVQLDARGIKSPNLGFKFKVKSKKVSTDFQPAWCFDIEEMVEMKPTDLAGLTEYVAPAIKKFNKWVEDYNSSGSNSTTSSTSSAPVESDVEVDEDEIPF
jgi:hypothetical protein